MSNVYNFSTKANFSSVDKMGDPQEKTLVFGNISWSLSEEDMKNEILKYGNFEITSVQIPRRHNGFSKGLAIVEFANVEQADDAKNKIHQQNIAGRVCYVSFSKDSPANPKEERRGRPDDRRDRMRRRDHRRDRPRRRYDDYSDDEYDYRRRRPRRRSRYYDYDYDYSDDDRDYRRRSRYSRDRRDDSPPRRRRDFSPSPRRDYSPSPPDSWSDSDRRRR